MKKFFAAMMVAAIGTSALAQYWNAYDYKLSFKTVTPKYSYKGDKTKYAFESYKQGSDTLTGWVVIPACANCVGEDAAIFMEESGSADVIPANVGFIFATRKGNKLAKNEVRPYIYAGPIAWENTVFGADIIETDDQPLASMKNNKYAAVRFTANNIPGDSWISSYIKLAKDTEVAVAAGILGNDNYGNGFIYHSGFGTTKAVGGHVICGSTTSCTTVNTANGTIYGGAEVLGLCSLTPMWDMCVVDEDGLYASTGYSAISGNWTLKYNGALSNSVNKYAILCDNATYNDVPAAFLRACVDKLGKNSGVIFTMIDGEVETNIDDFLYIAE